MRDDPDLCTEHPDADTHCWHWASLLPTEGEVCPCYCCWCSARQLLTNEDIIKKRVLASQGPGTRHGGWRMTEPPHLGRTIVIPPDPLQVCPTCRAEFLLVSEYETHWKATHGRTGT